MNKKVVFFCGALKEGGAERVISILANHISASGNEAEIVLYYEREIFYELSEKVKIISVEKETRSKNLVKNILWLHRYFRESEGVICSFLAPFNILALIVGIGTQKKIVVADRNDPHFVPESKVVRKVRDFIYRFADCIVVQTTNNKNYFSKAVTQKCDVICNPIDLGEKAGLALRTKKKKRIVSVGRLMKQKNQKMLISAFNLIHKDFPEYELTIYGEGPCRSELEDQIKELGLENFVFLPGNKKNVHELIVDAELFVLSSDYEGMPNALIEAMCLGVPVISTKVSGATDLIVHETNGMLVECNDVDGLAKCMIDFIRNRDKRELCSREAIKLNEKLAVASIVNQWMETIDK